MKISPRTIAESLHNKGIRHISGKWFYNEKEIKDINKYLYKFSAEISSASQLKEIINTFIDMFSESGNWYPMPIIEEAKNHKLEPLCYPLSDKILKLINKLVMGDEEYMFILCGVGGSGKSTVANIIKQIFDNDVASLSLSDLSNRFMMATGVSSRLIYSDELNSDDLNNAAIKTIISKQEITVDPKNETPFKIRFQGTLFFSCNNPPKLDLSDSGVVRRICYISMNEKIKNPDLTLQKRLYTHEELVNVVAHALSMDMTNWFDDFKNETRMLLKSNNSVWICRNNSGLSDTDYSDYNRKAAQKGMRPMSEPKWANVRELLLEWEREEDEELPF